VRCLQLRLPEPEREDRTASLEFAVEENTPLTPSQPETSAGSFDDDGAMSDAQSFWHRFGRAAALLLMATTAHLWLLGTSQGPFEQSDPAVVAEAVEPAAVEAAAATEGVALRQANARGSSPAPRGTPAPAGSSEGERETTSLMGSGEAAPAEAVAASRSRLATAGRTPAQRAAPLTQLARVDGRGASAPAARQTANPNLGPAATAGADPDPAPAPEAARGTMENGASAGSEPAVLVLDEGAEPTAPALGASSEPLNAPEPREAAPVAPVATEAAAADKTSAAGPAAEPRNEESFVRKILEEYATAFERLDVQAAKAVWPTVDARALARAFRQLEAQQLTFDSCGITISGRDANARCLGDSGYQPKVGARAMQITPREWTFNLARNDDGWQIVQATVR
jgi:hypothetical protein